MNSVVLELSLEQTAIERQTYSLLEWVGDVGGFYDGLKLIASYFVAPIATIALQSELLAQHLKRENKGFDNESNKSYLRHMACCFRKKTPYQKMLNRALSKIERQLDIVKFLHQQRLLLISVLATAVKSPHLSQINLAQSYLDI